jgi:hypothetical protein
VLWLGCRCCRPSVSTICGRIMIGLSLSSVSKHNMWSCYVFCRAERKILFQNLTLGYMTKTLNQIFFFPPMIGLSLLLSVSKHKMWSYYDLVYCNPSVNTICDRIMIGLSLFSSVNTIVRIFISFVAQSAKFCSRI